MNDITHIVLLLLSAAVIFTTRVQAKDIHNGSEEDGACDKLTLKIGQCTSYDETSDIRYEGLCPYIFRYNIFIKYNSYESIILNISNCSQVNEAMCGQLNRKGLLCSKCKAEYGPDLYSRSSSCVPCNGYSHGKWILYFVLLLTPLTIFFLIIIIFNVRATSPPFTAFLLFCQIFTNMYRTNPDPYIRMYVENTISPYVYKLVFTVIDIWSLDFFRYQLIGPICVSSSLSNLQVLMLELIPPFYLLILMVLTYMLIELHARNVRVIVQLWKPFNRCVVKLRRTYDPRASIFNAFATFLLLSYSSILVISSHSVYNVAVYDPFRFVRLYINPNKSTSSKLPHFIPVIILLVFLTISPILILALYPIKRIQKIFFLLCCKDIRCLKSFVDAFQGHYKDGTNGTRDYRAMASLQFIIRAVLVYNHWKDNTTYFQ